MIAQFTTLAAAAWADRAAAGLRAPRVDWQARQFARLQTFLQYTHRHSQFYRRLWGSAGVDPLNIQAQADLNRLPVVDHTLWRNAPADEMPGAAWHDPLVWYESTGTTGEPAWTPVTLWDDIRVHAHLLGVLRRYGLRWTDTSVQISGRTRGVEARQASHRSLFGRVQWVAVQASAAERLRLLRQFRPQLVGGGAWVLWRVALEAIRAGRPLPPVKLVATGGEIMTGVVRRTLAEAFSAPVVDRYAANDFGQLAGDCPEARLHIVPEVTYIEIMDGSEPAAAGTEGDVLVTNLLSHARPLVRVRTGDRAAWGADPCPCGSPLPYLAYVAGRAGSEIVAPGGRRIGWPAVESALAPLAGQVLGYQLEQLGRERVRARLSFRTPPESLEPVRQRLRALLDSLTLEIELTDDLRIEPGGKTLPVCGLID